MDRKISDKVKNKRKLKTGIKFASGIVVVIVVLMAFKSIFNVSVEYDDIQLSTVERGDVEASVSASGDVLPEFEEVITSSINSKILKLHKIVGDKVENGTSLMEIDKRKALVDLSNMENELLVKQNKIKQLRLRLEKNLIDLKTNYKIKEIQLKSSRALVEEEKHLLKIGGGTKEKLNKAELNLQVTQLELDKIKETISNSENSMEADLEELSLGIKIQRKNVKELKHSIAMADVKSENDGVVTQIQNQIGKMITTGDILARIANLDSYKIQASISEEHATKLRIGGGVKVTLSDTAFYAEISGVKPSVERGLVKFNIKMDKKYCNLLRPNQKVDVSVITSMHKNVLRVKNAAFYKGEKNKSVFVYNGEKAVKRAVIFGKSNFNFVEITSGLSEGDIIIVSGTDDFKNAKEVEIIK